MKVQSERENRALDVLKLSELFARIDYDGSGFGLKGFLGDHGRLWASRDTRHPYHCVRKVMGILSSATDVGPAGAIRKDHFRIPHRGCKHYHREVNDEAEISRCFTASSWRSSRGPAIQS